MKVELCQLCSSPIPKPCRCKTGTSRPEAAWRIFGLPSGKHSHDYGNSQFSTGKSKYFYGSFSSLPEGTPFVVDFPIENGLQTGPLVLQRAPPPGSWYPPGLKVSRPDLADLAASRQGLWALFPCHGWRSWKQIQKTRDRNDPWNIGILSVWQIGILESRIFDISWDL